MLIAQLSDLHPRRPEAAALERALAHLLAPPRRPDAVPISGDCTDTGHPDGCAALRTPLEPLPMPVYAVPGNHDDRAAMTACLGVPGTHALPGFDQYAVEDLPVRVVALDAHVAGQGGGELCAARLGWLEVRLAEQPTRPTPTLLMLHHPPLTTGLRVMDSLGLADTQGLREAVARYHQVLRTVAGHVHMAVTQGFAGSVLMTCPGTDVSLLPGVGQPGKLIVQNQPPLCLLRAWDEHTGLLSFASIIGPSRAEPWETWHDGQGWLS